MAESEWWGVPSAIAWICFRDPALCETIARKLNANRLDVCVFAAWRQVKDGLAGTCSIEEAESQFCDAGVSVKAIPINIFNNLREDRCHVDVPSHEWPFLQIGHIRDRIGLLPRAGAGEFSQRYVNVLVRSSVVVKRWPSIPKSTNGRPRTVNRDLFIQIALQKLEDEGDLAQFKPGWRTLADLQRAVRTDFENRGFQCGDTTAKELTKEAREKFCAQRRGR